jgi:hypothetical protein
MRLYSQKKIGTVCTNLRSQGATTVVRAFLVLCCCAWAHLLFYWVGLGRSPK